VHPQTDPTELLWPLDFRMGSRRDTWVERLILLYLAAIADLELESLVIYVDNREDLEHSGLEEWSTDNVRRIRSTDIRAELRMPGAPPHEYDAFTERVWTRVRKNDEKSGGDHPRFADDVRPYLDPNVLARVVSVHHGVNELLAQEQYRPPVSSITG